MTLEDVVVGFGANVSNYLFGMNQMQVASLSATQSIALAAAAIPTAVAKAATSAMATVGASVAQLALDYRQHLTSFETMLGSVDRGRKLFADVEEYAFRSPYESKGLAKQASALLAMGVEAHNILPVLERIGDIAGADFEKFNRLSYVTGEVMAKGVLHADDLRQFAGVGVGRKEFAKTMGIEVPEFDAKMHANQVDANVVMATLNRMGRPGERFHGQTELANNTVRGQLASVTERASSFGGKAGDALFAGFDVAGKLGVVAGWMGRLESYLPSITSWAERANAQLNSWYESLKPTIERALPLAETLLNGVADAASWVGKQVQAAGRWVIEAFQDERFAAFAKRAAIATGAVALLATGLYAASVGAGVLAAIAGVVFTPVGIAVAAVVGGVALLGAVFHDQLPTMREFWDGVKVAADKTWQFLKPYWEDLKGWVKNFVESATPLWDQFSETMKGGWEVAKSLWKDAKQAYGALSEQFAGAGKSLSDMIPSWKEVRTAAEGFLKYLKDQAPTWDEIKASGTAAVRAVGYGIAGMHDVAVGFGAAAAKYLVLPLLDAADAAEKLGLKLAVAFNAGKATAADLLGAVSPVVGIYQKIDAMSSKLPDAGVGLIVRKMHPPGSPEALAAAAVESERTGFRKRIEDMAKLVIEYEKLPGAVTKYAEALKKLDAMVPKPPVDPNWRPLDQMGGDNWVHSQAAKDLAAGISGTVADGIHAGVRSAGDIALVLKLSPQVAEMATHLKRQIEDGLTPWDRYTKDMRNLEAGFRGVQLPPEVVPGVGGLMGGLALAAPLGVQLTAEQYGIGRVKAFDALAQQFQPKPAELPRALERDTVAAQDAINRSQFGGASQDRGAQVLETLVAAKKAAEDSAATQKRMEVLLDRIATERPGVYQSLFGPRASDGGSSR